jgi:iron(III) transport system permease protein
MAAVLSAVLVVPALAVFLVQKYYLDRRSFTTITGKPVAGLKRVTTSKKTKWFLFSFCSLIVLFILSIFTVVFISSFVKVLGVNNTFTLNNFIEGIVKSDALKNSWILAVFSAIITTILGITIAFLVSRKRFPGRNGLDFLTLLPASLPGTFIGIGLVLAFNEKPMMLTGTGVIIVIAMVMRQLPVGYRNSVATFKQIDKSIEEAATNLGANSFTVIRTIIFPMLRNAMSTSIVYSFMKSMNTLSAVIFLVSPQWVLGSIAILSFAEHGFIGVASATAVGMIGIIFITFGAAKLLLKDKIHIFDI